MALLRNREVTILGRSEGETESPNYTVLYPHGDRENVKLSELQLTKQEADEMKKAHGENVMVDVKVIEDKDLQEIRDSQDKAKIEARQAQADTSKPVEVKKVFVEPSEVAEKTPAKKSEKK